MTYRQSGQDKSVVLVGDDEADPHDGRISFSSPVARAMMDAEVGETVDFAGKADAIEIIGIEPVTEA